MPDAETSISEEPGAGIRHAGICAGAARATGRPTARLDLPAQRLSAQNQAVKFDVVGTIEQIETIAAGPSVKVRMFLRKTYGRGKWRKRKGVATVRLLNGDLRRVELHWYEAHGIGRRDFKIKSYLDKE